MRDGQYDESLTNQLHSPFMTKSCITFLAATATFSSFAQAQTALIDNTTRNGSFEIAADGNPFDGADNQINNLEFWTTTASPIGTTAINQTQARNNQPTTAGDYRAIIGDNGAPFNGLFMDTGYTVQSGDTFDLSFEYIPAFLWDSSDTLEFYLYTEANSGTPIYAGTITGTTTADAFTVSGAGSVNPADIGENLVIEFNYALSAGGFIGVDEVALTVIPEPSSYALVLGASLLALAVQRRRKA